MLDDNKSIAKIFKALCDENRVAIVKSLQSGSKCACEISDELNLSQSKLSYHMKILCDSKIVECWYIGKWTHYKISSQGSQFAKSILDRITTVDKKSIDILDYSSAKCNDCN